jgi:hypothetical protein
MLDGAGMKAAPALLNLAVVGESLADFELETTALQVFVETLDAHNLRGDRRGLFLGALGLWFGGLCHDILPSAG